MKKITNILLILTLILSTSIISKGQEWELVLETEGEVVLTSIAAADSLNIWSVGFQGPVPNNPFIIRTEDGGQTWEEQLTNIEGRLQEIYFSHHDTAWIIGSWDIIKTVNGGGNWSQSQVDTTGLAGILKGFSFSGNTGYAISTYGTLLKSIDYGLNWIQLPFSESPSGVEYTSIAFLDQDIGIVAGGSGPNNWMMRTSDGGTSWSQPNYDPNVVAQGWITDLFVLNDSIMFAAGNVGKVLRSDDAGLNWYALTRVEYAATTQALNGIYFNNPDTGWVVGTPVSAQHEFARAFSTVDGGNSWIRQLHYTQSTYQAFNDITFSESGEGWICGAQWGGGATNGGIVFKGTGDIITAITDYQDDEGETVSKMTNYPNPFHAFTNVLIELEEPSTMDLIVYNAQGIPMWRIINRNLSKGQHFFNVDTDNWPAGLYFCTLKVKDEVNTKVIVKTER